MTEKLKFWNGALVNVTMIVSNMFDKLRELERKFMRWVCHNSDSTIIRAAATMVFQYDGIAFDYNGDWVFYVVPWLRQPLCLKPWHSTSFMGGFNSLREIDEMWDEYNMALKMKTHQ